MFLQQLINGITIGGIYALVALGYSMVYSVLQIVNWAHADVLMFSTFIGLVLFGAGVPVWLVIVLTGAIGSLLGMTVERIAYRPITKNRRMAVLVSALGMSVLLQNLAQRVFGTGTKSFPAITQVPYKIGSITLTNVQLLILGLTAVMLIALYLLVYKTKIGTAMRACSVSIDNAKLMGINTNMIISTTFGIGTFIAAVSGVLIGTYYNAVYSTMGYMLGMKAFAAAIFGGIGSIPGAVLGGFLIGIAESLGAGYISTGYRDAYAFIIMIVVLVIRPSGLLGTKQLTKV